MMTRSERLLMLLHHLRLNRYPVSADMLAERLGVSVRTVYRDIETLRGQGAEIEGEAGIGLVLKSSGFVLPTLMFDEYEIEALAFGMRWAVTNADASLADAAKSALAKINAVLPKSLSESFKQQALYPISAHGTDYALTEQQVLSIIREALRGNLALTIDYADAEERTTCRTIWPVAMAYFDESRLLAAWCTLRQDFRHFRPDRIVRAKVGEPYDIERAVLLAQWQRYAGVDLHRFDF